MEVGLSNGRAGASEKHVAFCYLNPPGFGLRYALRGVLFEKSLLINICDPYVAGQISREGTRSCICPVRKRNLDELSKRPHQNPWIDPHKPSAIK